MLEAVTSGSSTKLNLGEDEADATALGSVSLDVESSRKSRCGDVHTSTDKLATNIPMIDSTMT